MIDLKIYDNCFVARTDYIDAERASKVADLMTDQGYIVNEIRINMLCDYTMFIFDWGNTLLLLGEDNTTMQELRNNLQKDIDQVNENRP